jgi:hypothetical protein
VQPARKTLDVEAMLSQPATKVFFETSEPRAAQWISEVIGEIEVGPGKDSRSLGRLRSKKSYAMEITSKALVIASELSRLRPLRGFIKQGNRVVPVRFALAKKRGHQPEFIERMMPEVVPKPVPAGTPTSPIKPSAALWDESKWIE